MLSSSPPPSWWVYGNSCCLTTVASHAAVAKRTQRASTLLLLTRPTAPRTGRRCWTGRRCRRRVAGGHPTAGSPCGPSTTPPPAHPAARRSMHPYIHSSTCSNIVQHSLPAQTGSATKLHTMRAVRELCSNLYNVNACQSRSCPAHRAAWVVLGRDGAEVVLWCGHHDAATGCVRPP